MSWNPWMRPGATDGRSRPSAAAPTRRRLTGAAPLALALLAVWLTPPASRAAGIGDTEVATSSAAAAPVALANSEERLLRAADGSQYRISIATPVQDAPPGGWPVVYVIDGNAWFLPLAVQSRLRSRSPGEIGEMPAVIVGIGYPGARLFDTPRRFRELTPPSPRRDPEMPEDPAAYGGADRLLDFIEHELKPAIARDYRVDPHRQALFGHSLGGLFVLHALYTRPQSFQTFAAVSPSIWWNDRYVVEEERAFAARAPQSAAAPALLLAIGEAELEDMVADADALAARLRPLPERQLRLRFERLPGEDHVSVPPVAFVRLLRWALAPTGADKAFYLQAPPATTEAPALPADAAALAAMAPAARTRLRQQLRALPPERRQQEQARLQALLAALDPVRRRQLEQEAIAEDRREGRIDVVD